jgi:WD40 repeat protein
MLQCEHLVFILWCGLCRSHDNSKFASSGGDRSVFLWDVTAGVTTRRLPGHMGKINVVEFNEDATVLASGEYTLTSATTPCLNILCRILRRNCKTLGSPVRPCHYFAFCFALNKYFLQLPTTPTNTNPRGSPGCRANDAHRSYEYHYRLCRW